MTRGVLGGAAQERQEKGTAGSGEAEFRRLLDLLGDLARGLADSGADDARIIAVELRSMLLARECFLRLLRQSLDAAGPEGKDERGGSDRIDPTRFLRAWGDSVARVLQLLKARRDAQEQGGGAALDRLLDQALNELEVLPGLQALRADSGRASSGEEADNGPTA